MYNEKMIRRRKISRSAAEKARDTAGIIGSLRHEGYVPNAENDAVHARQARGEITTDEAIAIFRERALAWEAILLKSQSVTSNWDEARDLTDEDKDPELSSSR